MEVGLHGTPGVTVPALVVECEDAIDYVIIQHPTAMDMTVMVTTMMKNLAATVQV